MAATFLGFVDEHGKFALDYPAQFKAYAAKVFRGTEVELELRARRTKRSLRQNAGFWAMVKPFADHLGYHPDELKRELLMLVFGTSEVTSPLSGEVKLIPNKPHTSQLTVKEFSDLIEQTLILAAGQGCVLLAPDEYRRAHPEIYGKPAARTRRAA